MIHAGAERSVKMRRSVCRVQQKEGASDGRPITTSYLQTTPLRWTRVCCERQVLYRIDAMIAMDEDLLIVVTCVCLIREPSPQCIYGPARGPDHDSDGDEGSLDTGSL